MPKDLTNFGTNAIVAFVDIDAVKDIQVKKALTNQQFADILGIEVGSWYRIKSGRAPLNDKFLVRVHRAFPELGIFLSKDSNRESAETPQNSHQNALSRKIGGLWARVRNWFRG